MENKLCPLCQTDKHMKKTKELYGHFVCKKCYYDFANKRQLAFFFDSIGWKLLMILLGVTFGIVGSIIKLPLETIDGFASILGFVLLPFFLFKDAFSGHSLGKFICGVKVINRNSGKPGGFLMSFKRNLPTLIPFMPIVIGIQLCKGNRTGDNWSDSKVIWKKYADHEIFNFKT